MGLAMAMLGRDGGNAGKGCVWGDTNILLLAVLWGFKYHRALRLRCLAAAHPELSPWFHLAAQHRQIHLSKLDCNEQVRGFSV